MTAGSASPGWVWLDLRLHYCCTLSNKCALVAPAITTHSQREGNPYKGTTTFYIVLSRSKKGHRCTHSISTVTWLYLISFMIKAHMSSLLQDDWSACYPFFTTVIRLRDQVPLHPGSLSSSAFGRPQGPSWSRDNTLSAQSVIRPFQIHNVLSFVHRHLTV